MGKIRKFLPLLFFLFLNLSFIPSLQASPPLLNPENFVKSFYKDYFKDNSLARVKKYFDNRLYLLLQKEEQWSKNKGEAVRYCLSDANHFTGTQDIPGPVTSTQLIQKNSKIQVKVTFKEYGEARPMIVELEKGTSGWKIKNFINFESVFDPITGMKKVEYNLIKILEEEEKCVRSSPH